MGLVDETRDRRDSWGRRLEEQRVSQEPYDYEFEKRNARRIEEEIKKNQKMVGQFPPVEELSE